MKESIQEYARGIAGGMMFSLPLLYTMEMWWYGFILHPLRLATLVVSTFVLLLGYNRFAGIRHDSTWGEVVIDSFEEMGIGLVLSATMLFLLNRISPQDAFPEALCKIVMEGMLVAIGVSVGTAQLGAGECQEDESRRNGWFAQLTLGICGAVLFAANIGPTEEVQVLAMESTPWHQLGLVVASFGIGGIVLYFSEFNGSKAFARNEGRLDVVTGSVLSYNISFLVSAIILWFFGRMDDMPLAFCLSQTIVLAFPASLGASAGRLLVQ